MKKNIKESVKKVEVYKFTTSDGKTFEGINRSKTLELAKNHQVKIDLDSKQEIIGKELWQAFGLPINAYYPGLCPWDISKEEVERAGFTLDEVEKLINLLDVFNDITSDDADCFGYIIDYLTSNRFIDNYKNIKIVMSVLEKHPT